MFKLQAVYSLPSVEHMTRATTEHGRPEKRAAVPHGMFRNNLTPLLYDRSTHQLPCIVACVMQQAIQRAALHNVHLSVTVPNVLEDKRQGHPYTARFFPRHDTCLA